MAAAAAADDDADLTAVSDEVDNDVPNEESEAVADVLPIATSSATDALQREATRLHLTGRFALVDALAMTVPRSTEENLIALAAHLTTSLVTPTALHKTRAIFRWVTHAIRWLGEPTPPDPNINVANNTAAELKRQASKAHANPHTKLSPAAPTTPRAASTLLSPKAAKAPVHRAQQNQSVDLKRKTSGMPSLDLSDRLSDEEDDEDGDDSKDQSKATGPADVASDDRSNQAIRRKCNSLMLLHT